MKRSHRHRRRHVALALGLPAAMVACEAAPARVAIDDHLPVCGASTATDRGLDCADPVIHVDRALGAEADVLIAITHGGTLTATELAGSAVGNELVRAELGADAKIDLPPMLCDFDGNDATDVAYRSRGVFVLWNSTAPGDPSVPASPAGWEESSKIVCADADLDNFDELWGFDAASELRVAAGSSEGLQPQGPPLPIDGWAGVLAPVLAVVRDPECAPVMLARPVRAVDGIALTNEATFFVLGAAGPEPRQVETFATGDSIRDVFLLADPSGLLGMLWIRSGDLDRLLFFEEEGRCQIEMQPALEMELPGHATRVELDEERRRVTVIHEPNGDGEVFAWAAGSVERIRMIEGQALDIAVVGPTDDEQLVIARPSPPFLEIEPF